MVGCKVGGRGLCGVNAVRWGGGGSQGGCGGIRGQGECEQRIEVIVTTEKSGGSGLM